MDNLPIIPPLPDPLPADAALIGKLRHQLAQATDEAARLRALSQPAFTPYTENELREWFPVVCNHCGWRGLSRDCTGGGPIADTGDFNEITCPQCWKDGEGKAVDVREVLVLEGEQPATVAQVPEAINAVYFDVPANPRSAYVMGWNDYRESLLSAAPSAKGGEG